MPIRLPQAINLDRIFLYEENPRHEPIETQSAVIEYLCKDEQVFNLARSISEAGTNPLAATGLVRIAKPGRAAAKPGYQVWEGNRRICAIKLLNDPDLAPAHLRKDFAKLAKESDHVPIEQIAAVIFDDHDELKYWMGIIHDGPQAGVGLLPWNAEQKARHFGSNRNRVALAVLDFAEGIGLISKEERKGKLTTAQRYLNSSVVREAIGLDATNPESLAYNRPPEEFQKQLERFVSDLKVGKTVTSRNDRSQIDTYGRKLARSAEISGERTEPMSLKTAASRLTKSSKRKVSPKKPRPPTHLEYDKRLAEALEPRSKKLESLYYSICSVELEHTPLLVIGVWAFVECLAALAGKRPDSDFGAFFSNERMSNAGLGSGKLLAPFREALTRIARNGNATKHHEVSALFDGKQLMNDLATITPLLTKTAESIALKK